FLTLELCLYLYCHLRALHSFPTRRSSDLIAQGITGAIGKVTGAVKGVLKAARNLLPFSPPKDKSSPMVGLEKNGIVDNIAQGIMNNEGEIQRAMNQALNVDMPMMNGHVSHSIKGGNVG